VDSVGGDRDAQRVKRLELVWIQAVVKTVSAEGVEVGKVDRCTDDVEQQGKNADNHEREPRNKEPASSDARIRFAVPFVVRRSRCRSMPQAHALLLVTSPVRYQNVKIDSTTRRETFTLIIL